MRFLAAFALLILLPFSVVAQDRPNTILVLDASGSMWGQIDGVAKITIAQQVITDLLATLPDDENLGLTVYGARSRGDCTDIQTVIEPGPGTKGAIAAAIAGIKPLGKTPMTDAIIAAATALRYTEEKATVILVSDGVETCNPDPCAAAALLEQAGIDFTAHVVGFDVGSDADALRQMQCIADETGGRFLTAANSTELTAALTEVAKAPEPPPAPQVGQITFMAVEQGNFIAFNDAVLWTVTAADGTAIIPDRTAPGFTEEIPVGSYLVTGVRIKTGETATGDLRVAPAPGTFALEFPKALPPATLDAADSAPIGSDLAVTWTGPNDALDNIQVGSADDGYVYSYTYTKDGNPVTVTLPSTPGTYELRYRLHDDTTIATRAITVTEAEVSLTAPDSAPAGSTVAVAWVGPNADLDNIAVGTPGQSGASDYAYTQDGSPVSLTLPAEPGTYELRYMFEDKEIIATRPIIVTEAEVSLTAPDTVPAGADFAVTWAGPNAEYDNVQIATIGGGYLSYAYTTGGNPLTLTAPAEPGDYELRYAFRDSETIATRPITVTEVKAQLIAAATAALADGSVVVGWDGPDYGNDFIGIGPVGGGYETYTMTRSGNPSTVPLPETAGDYEIRYYLGQGETPIATAPLRVTK